MKENAVKNRVYKIKNDVIFKELFSKKGNEEFLIEFLSSLLKIKINKIEIQKEAELGIDNVTDKIGSIDILATINDNEKIDIEMQIRNEYNIIERTTRYSSRLIAGQLEKNDKKENDKLGEWLTFIDDENREAVEKVMSKNTLVKKAHEEYEYLVGDERVKRIAQLQERWAYERASAIRMGKEEGEAKGLKKGRKEGRIIGFEDAKKDIAKNMLKENVDIDTIIKYTKLSKEEIETLKVN